MSIDTSKIKPEVLEQAGKLAPMIKFEDGHAKVGVEPYHEAMEKAGFPQEKIAEFRLAEGQYKAAAGFASGEAAIKSFEANPEQETATVEFDLGGRNSWNVSTSRRSEFRNVQDPSKPPIVKYGKQLFGAKVSEDKGSTGQLAQVSDAIGKMAMAALAKDEAAK
jgi:hypothetical protein